MYIAHPLVDMREKGDSASKVVSQALFGEKVDILQPGPWCLIRTPDTYEGWIPLHTLHSRTTPYTTDLETTRLSAHLYTIPDTEYGPLLTLPFGSKLKKLSEDPRWFEVELVDTRKAYIQKGDVTPEPHTFTTFTQKFLHLPYTWGGRSSFGYDCSGFVQMVYKRFGVPLPRDARQQILHGRPIPIEELSLGDLLFWGASESKIGHVAIALNNSEFIHTSSRENLPHLRISKLSDPFWNGSETYPYRAARRFDLKL